MTYLAVDLGENHVVDLMLNQLNVVAMEYWLLISVCLRHVVVEVVRLNLWIDDAAVSRHLLVAAVAAEVRLQFHLQSKPYVEAKLVNRQISQFFAAVED